MNVVHLVWDANVARRRAAYAEGEKFQEQVVKFLQWALPSDAFFFAIPNGGRRNAREAARLKKQGLVPGVPDLCVVWRATVRLIELKYGTGGLSATQKDVKRKLEQCGVTVHLCRTVDEVEHALRSDGIPLKVSVTI